MQSDKNQTGLEILESEISKCQAEMESLRKSGNIPEKELDYLANKIDELQKQVGILKNNDENDE